ncbi:hypothetical protein N7522_009619 [Penicillium canescens]|nr:hypothetical protein N7522_009619 [Penicillium canescens]KAJ6177437.1 hypothetical protein N7485_004351 [Penicillium canescens]
MSDHCLNHIRQSIQCHMDLTPVPAMYFDSVNSEVGNFDVLHTCRDISRLRGWMAEKMATAERSLYFNPEHDLGYVQNDDYRKSWDTRIDEFH